MADAEGKIYLPRMKVRAGFRHSYQGKNVVVVEPGAKPISADDDAKAAKSDKAKASK